ncbi:hypothetical protein SAMN05216383_10997 [Prevotella sp. KH2C16]|nr:hypothetical protein SAMN05216383_10997 [Prevotella sp. KH2C16]
MLLMLCLPLFAQDRDGNTLRIATYNIQHGKGISSDTLSSKKQLALIERINPDLIAIEEVDSMTTRTPGRFLLGEYA